MRSTKLCVLLPAALLVLALTGCGGESIQEPPEPAPEDSVRISAVRALEGVRRLGQGVQAPAALTCSQEDRPAAVPALAAEPEEWQVLLQTVLSDFTYRIDAVAVEEDTAAVTVTLETKPVGEVLLDWMGDLQRDRPRLRALSSLPKEEQTQQLQAQLLESIADAGTKECAAVLPFALEAGQWTLTPAGQSALTAALRGE